jgi:hypothetical protein
MVDFASECVKIINLENEIQSEKINKIQNDFKLNFIKMGRFSSNLWDG